MAKSGVEQESLRTVKCEVYIDSERGKVLKHPEGSSAPLYGKEVAEVVGASD